MKISWIYLSIVALASACTTGMTYKNVSPLIPSLPLTRSRIFFYRVTAKDPAIQPSVKIKGEGDDEVVGIVKPDSFFFIDREPGVYRLAIGSAVDQTLSVKLTAGQTRYIRFDVKVGLAGDYFVPEENNEIDGADEVLPLNYIGPPLPKPVHERASNPGP